MEEMRLPYKLRRVDLLAGVENDAEFLAINPATCYFSKGRECRP